MALAKTEIRPTGQQTEPGKKGGGVRSDNDAAEGIQQKKEGWKVLYSHLNQAFKDCNGVFGDELFECDQERSLNRYAAAYLGKSGIGVTGQLL